MWIARKKICNFRGRKAKSINNQSCLLLYRLSFHLKWFPNCPSFKLKTSYTQSVLPLFAFSLPKCLSFTLTECTDVSFQPQLSPRLAAVYLISSPSELLSFFFCFFFFYFHSVLCSTSVFATETSLPLLSWRWALSSDRIRLAVPSKPWNENMSKRVSHLTEAKRLERLISVVSLLFHWI